ncbi:DUF3558 domain-containing protein [Rhodococcus sp. D2-41]|uniref:DUF3558 domain-containing protein n=1 Tax=Speluncibacter jeojiensis TaxID=2710754 RepID=UPI0024108A0F|nr:DUF3558 domain-containing protein [Rhodococcus sp. D2-41]MDG3012631.1 DUF3558 domain-containing protein [Rhodococcus sp. D2-41]
MRALVGCAALGLALSVAGCASATTGQSVAGSTSASSANAQSVSTPTPRLTDDSGRPQIMFDPCNDIQPGTVAKMGYDPGYKDNSDFRGGSYTFMSCGFHSEMYSLGISSGNITTTEQETQQKRDSPTKVVTPITVDGRAGWIARDPSRTQICTLAFSTSYGEVMLDRFQREKAQKSGLDVCDGIEGTAQIIASILPPGA